MVKNTQLLYMSKKYIDFHQTTRRVKQRKEIGSEIIRIISADSQAKKWLVEWTNGEISWMKYYMLKDSIVFEQYLENMMYLLDKGKITPPSYIS